MLFRSLLGLFLFQMVFPDVREQVTWTYLILAVIILFLQRNHVGTAVRALKG